MSDCLSSHPRRRTARSTSRGAARRTFQNAALGWLLVGAVCLGGCSYVGTVGRQSYYTVRNRVAPDQRIQKHMIARPTVFVYGQVLNRRVRSPGPVAVAAVSDTSPPRVVDVNANVGAESYFGLNLPDGDYHLLVVIDRDGDGVGRETEVIGCRAITVDRSGSADGVQGEMDIDLRSPCDPTGWTVPSFALHFGSPELVLQSVFFPRGTLRTLDDPVFDARMATLGLYEPAAFLECAPMMFYALEEQAVHKVPVVFVHGIEGTARQFAPMVAALDRRRYQPWFFHYPSGVDLAQLGSIFHKIFLSGRVIPLEDSPIVIVAHSMGGLVVRDALSRMTGTNRENRVGSLITISSPLGGHPSARASQRAPVAIPSWLDLNPDSAFIRNLRRAPLPAGMNYHLLYTYGTTDPTDPDSATDGVVPMSAQLPEASVRESTERHGYAHTHVSVLSDPAVIADVVRWISGVKTNVPEDHLRYLDMGGYNIELGPEFSPLEAFLVRSLGHYMEALVDGVLEPFHPEQEKFIRAARGETRPTNPAAHAWVKLKRGSGSRSESLTPVSPAPER